MNDRPRLSLLGGFRLCRADGRPVGIPRRKGAALVAFLACAPDGRATRDAAISLLWPDFEPEPSRRNLRQVLMNVRHGLARARLPLLDVAGQDLVLDVGGLQVDVLDFERLMAKGTIETLRAAADLYRGDFLADSDVSTPTFEDWLAHSRDRFREEALSCLSKLFVLFQERGDHEAAVRAGHRALALDPTREEVHRRLMAIHVARAEPARALQQYARCVECLRRELDVGPDRETTALHEAILAGRASAGGALASVPAVKRADAGVSAPIVGAPAHLVAFTIGRRDDLARLGGLLDLSMERGARVACIAGEMGIGKTHLIDSFVRRRAAEGISARWIRASPAELRLDFSLCSMLTGSVTHAGGPRTRGLRELPAAFAAPGMVEQRRSSNPQEAVLRVLRDHAARRPLILVVEDLQWADAKSVEALGYAIRRSEDLPLLCIVTRRSIAPGCDRSGNYGAAVGVHHDLLRVGRWHEFELPPLSPGEAKALARRLASVRGREPEREKRAFRDIWRLSCGNAGAIVRTVQVVNAPTHVGGARGRWVPAGLLRSLDPPCRALARLASALWPRIDWPVLRHAAGGRDEDVHQTLERLIACGLLRTVDDRIAFTDQRMRRVIYRTLLPPQRRVLHAALAGAIEDVYSDELAPFFRALAYHRFMAGDLLESLRYQVLDGEFCAARGRASQASAIYHRVLNIIAARADVAGSAALRAQVWVRLARLANEREAFAEAMEFLDRAVLWPESRAPVLAAEIDMLRARLYFRTAAPAQGLLYLRRGLRRIEGAPSTPGWTLAERIVARMARLADGRLRAIEHLACYRSRASRLGLGGVVSEVSAAIALLRVLAGQSETASQDADAAVQAARHFGGAGALAAALQVCGIVRSWLQDHRRAVGALRAAVHLARRDDDWLRHYAASGHLGLALVAAGHPAPAAHCLIVALRAGRRLGTRCYAAAFHAGLAEALSRMRRLAPARRHGLESLRLAAKSNDAWGHAVALRVLAEVLLQSGRVGSAERYGRAALLEQRALGLTWEERLTRQLLEQAARRLP